MTTVEIKLDKNYDISKPKSWCQSNCTGKWQAQHTYKQYGVVYGVFMFECNEDASYFKLVWG